LRAKAHNFFYSIPRPEGRGNSVIRLIVKFFLKHFFKYHFLFFFWMLVIFMESSMSREFYPEIDIWNAPKILHVLIYGFLAMVCYISLIHQSKIKIFRDNPLTWTLVICILYGASDEFHQTFVPGRSGLVTDVMIDTAGALIMILIIKYFLSRKMRLFAVHSMT
jgi:hypothetical protein